MVTIEIAERRLFATQTQRDVFKAASELNQASLRTVSDWELVMEHAEIVRELVRRGLAKVHVSTGN